MYSLTPEQEIDVLNKLLKRLSDQEVTIVTATRNTVFTGVYWGDKPSDKVVYSLDLRDQNCYLLVSSESFGASVTISRNGQNQKAFEVIERWMRHINEHGVRNELDSFLAKIT